MNRILLLSASLVLLALISGKATAYEMKKSALFVFLHEVKPLEEEGLKALKERNYALALRKYREALKGYERLWKDYPDLPAQRPHGIDRMVDESIAACKKVIEEITDEGEAQDEFYQELNQLVRVDFEGQDVRSIAKMLTFLTDVNIIVDDTVFTDSAAPFKPEISLRVAEAVPLRKIIVQICEQTGLAYSIETDHVYLSTRIKLDKQE